jgi:hypothetical protein
MANHTMDHTHGGHMEHDQPPATHAHATLGVHNQMVVGVQTIYLSHLPMFDPQMPQHRFQVILEVALSWPDDAQDNYVRDRRNHPNERMYTMSPHPFEMVELDPQISRRTTLTGDIYRGHLERGGVAIITCADARIVNTVFFHEFDPNARPLDQLEYLLFGKEPDLFLAHMITRPPDFDQILAVTLSGTELAATDLARGIRVMIPARANTASARIKAGEKASGLVRLPDIQAGQPFELQLTAGTEFYFEEGELLANPMFSPTSEEQAAGF